MKNVRQAAEDEELNSAYKVMERALRHLESATGYVTYANTEDIKFTGQDIYMTTQKVDLTTERIEVSLLDQREQLDRFKEMMAANFGKLLDDQRKASAKKQTHEPQHNKDPSMRRYAAFTQVKRAFAVPADAAIQDRDIDYSFVPGTSAWLFKEEDFRRWSTTSSKDPLLWLSGDAGLGKSCLAFSTVRELKKLVAEQSPAGGARASVAYFYFRNEHEELRSVVNALACTVAQIARQSVSYCEQVAADLSGSLPGAKPFDLQSSNVSELWDRFFASKFKKGSDAHLFLILDGMDEADVEEANHLFELLWKIREDKLHIRVLLTGRPELHDRLNTVNVTQSGLNTLEVTKEKIAEDMQLIIRARLKTQSKLRKFRAQARKRITNKLLQKADSE